MILPDYIHSGQYLQRLPKTIKQSLDEKYFLFQKYTFIKKRNYMSNHTMRIEILNIYFNHCLLAFIVINLPN